MVCYIKMNRTIVSDTINSPRLQTPPPSIDSSPKRLSLNNTLVVEKNKYFDSCYTQILKTLDTRITISNIVKIITQCMKIVQSFTKLNGVEKKDLVIDVVQKLIRDSDHDEKLENALIDILEKIGHPVIDTVIVASKGKFFTNIKSGFMKWVKGCCM